MESSFALADSTQLEQVILNLCLNARDSLPSDSTGIIEIGIENVIQHTPGGDGTTAEFVMIAVLDNGCGIPDSMRYRIFEPFFTTKESGRGTDLGLSMAQDIVCEHSGWIEFDSAASQGREFRVFLPHSSDPKNIEDQIQAPDLSSPFSAKAAARLWTSC